MKTNKKAQLIKVDGTMEIITPKNGTDFQLDELQTYVEGLIDIVYFPNNEDLILICNDEGMYTKEYNSIASNICTRAYGRSCILYGDVVICKDDMVK